MTINIQQITGAVYGLALSPKFTNDHTVFAASSSGLYRSANAGASWEYTLDSLKLQDPLGISAVTLAPNFTEMPHVFAAGPGGILRSLDGGANWRVVMLPEPPPFITGLTISPDYANDGIIFATTLDDGFFRSSNRGGSWTAWNFGLFDMHVHCIAVSEDFSGDKTLFLGTESGVFQSINGGLGWQETAFPVESAPVTSLALSRGQLYAGTERDGLWFSDDGGKHWKQVASQAELGIINAVVYEGTQSSMIVMNEEGLLVSNDRGNSWDNLNAGKPFSEPPLAVAADLKHPPPSTRPVIVGLADGEIVSFDLNK